MSNISGRGRSLGREEISTSHRAWKTIRKAWEEILLDLPPDYDFPWDTFGWSNFAIAGENYEIARQACLALSLRGEFPSWSRNHKIPESIFSAFRATKQELVHGKNLNLPLTLLPTTAKQEDLANVY